MENADMENTDMENVDMQYADMENEDTENADMEYTDLENADTQNADMERSNDPICMCRISLQPDLSQTPSFAGLTRCCHQKLSRHWGYHQIHQCHALSNKLQQFLIQPQERRICDKH